MTNGLIATSDFERAYGEITSWPGYAPTPLRELPELARRFGVGHVYYKDEGARFGATSFKILGGAYAVTRLARGAKAPLTFTAATGGNHGAAVAWAARRAGKACALYIAENVSAQREASLARLGAQIVRVAGGYDRALEIAESTAAARGWTLVSDTSTRVDDTIVLDVMAGYGVLAREMVAQLDARREHATHIFIPCGVGGLAAATIAYIETVRTGRRPRFIACKAEAAAESSLSCLACGHLSAPAWAILARGLDASVPVSDDDVRARHSELRSAFDIDAGETAGAGYAAFAQVADDEQTRESLRIDRDSVVVIIGTESAPRPE